ncbi:amidase signature enzyme [Glonium stellatum]|uniref:Amidase signature enzyme n=1 Tax=Glonium stellatum TaxID=574774 RepID=A0A8E2EZT8_9PEZI|nr:amidase signature enzyme [Glonium stellatum]
MSIYPSRDGSLQNSTMKIGPNLYHVDPYPIPCSFLGVLNGNSSPITIMPNANSSITAQWLKDIFIISSVSLPSPTMNPSIRDALKSWGADLTVIQLYNRGVPLGPYYAAGPYLHRISRLYRDTQEAFVFGTIPSYGTTIRYEPLCVSGGRLPMIAVPSRLYYTRTSSKPLDGVRLAVKDNVDLAGTKTSMSSRAMEELYPEKDETAPAIQDLIDLGAIVVGKTKTSQFADVEEPTVDWVDTHCPFNPRGDGYLSPNYSSSGSAAAVAAYSWLDIALGTDTGGSIRDPAGVCGVFGIRCTPGSLSMDGIFPLVRGMDTLGLVARDVMVVNDVLSAWLKHCSVVLQRSPAQPEVYKPTRVIYFTDYLYEDGSEARRLFDDVVSRLESFFGTDRTTLNLEKEWENSNPSGKGKLFLDYLIKANIILNIKGPELWQNTAKFRHDYNAKFGRAPYVNPMIRNVLAPAPSGIVLHRNLLGSLAGCPEVVIPIGQTTYDSRISERKEYMPAAITLLGPPGCDLELCTIAEKFVGTQGLRTRVKLGCNAF